MLFEFYGYLSVTEKPNQQEFELFANWAKTLLQDFNEIDRYLLDPMHVLSYLKDIEDIKKWGIEVENKTPLLEKYIDFGNFCLIITNHFIVICFKKSRLSRSNISKATNNLVQFSNTISDKKIVFAGFNT